jgi:hypothetical protein
MGKPDIVYECHEAETSYRLRPNPDGEPGVGFTFGGSLEWSDGDSWTGEFFISPKAMEALGLALLEASKDVKG